MTIDKAHQILNAVKDGAVYSQFIIDQALKMTGDLNDIH